MAKVVTIGRRCRTSRTATGEVYSAAGRCPETASDPRKSAATKSRSSNSRSATAPDAPAAFQRQRRAATQRAMQPLSPTTANEQAGVATTPRSSSSDRQRVAAATISQQQTSQQQERGAHNLKKNDCNVKFDYNLVKHPAAVLVLCCFAVLSMLLLCSNKYLFVQVD